jgi:excisionase family DNA binding protein
MATETPPKAPFPAPARRPPDGLDDSTATPGGSASDRLLDAAEVAELLNVPTRWVREHSRNGHLPSIRLGRYVRFRRASVLAWVAEQEQGGAAWRRHRPVPGAGTK